MNAPAKKAIAALLATVMPCCLALAAGGNDGWHGKAQTPHYEGRIFPPWQHGRNNPARSRGLEFTVPEVNDLPDFHGDPFNARLVIFLGGNYYFAMAPLVKAFEHLHPELEGRLYYETIPPGLLIRQIRHGGTITVGNMTWTVKPDVFTAGRFKVEGLARDGTIEASSVVNFATNNLTIMVPRGNPAQVKSLADLGKPDIRLSMPNPEFEGIARQIQKSLVKAGGEHLRKTIYVDKVADGSTVLTHIHHRQTPLFLMQGLVDAGVTWQSEVRFMEQSGHPIDHVMIPASQNTTAIYAAGVIKHAAHPDAARQWVKFLASPAALGILRRYGFKAPPH